MRFVVTGAGGFLGSNLVRILLTESPHEVLAVSSKTPDQLSDLIALQADDPSRWPERLRTVKHGGEMDAETLDSRDVVVSAAFPWNRGGESMARGLEFLMDLYRSAARAQVRTFVNISSQSVYSQARTVAATEKSIVDCSTPYATAKYAIELAGEALLPRGVLINARMSSLIGVGYDIRVVNRLVDQIVRGEVLRIKGGDQAFDFMDVRDAARALIAVGERGAQPGGQVLNVGAGNELRLKNMVEVIVRVARRDFGIAAKVEWLPGGDDNRTLGLDASLLERLYGFHTAVTFEDSVRTIMQARLSRSF